MFLKKMKWKFLKWKVDDPPSFYILYSCAMIDVQCPFTLSEDCCGEEKMFDKKNVEFSRDSKKKTYQPPAPPPARTINHQRHSHVHNTSTQPSSQMIERKSFLSHLSCFSSIKSFEFELRKYANIPSFSLEMAVNDHWILSLGGLKEERHIKWKWQFMLIGY